MEMMRSNSSPGVEASNCHRITITLNENCTTRIDGQFHECPPCVSLYRLIGYGYRVQSKPP